MFKKIVYVFILLFFFKQTNSLLQQKDLSHKLLDIFPKAIFKAYELISVLTNMTTMFDRHKFYVYKLESTLIFDRYDGKMGCIFKGTGYFEDFIKIAPLCNSVTEKDEPAFFELQEVHLMKFGVNQLTIEMKTGPKGTRLSFVNLTTDKTEFFNTG